MVSLKLTHNYIGTMALFEIFVKGCPVYSWNLVKTAVFKLATLGCIIFKIFDTVHRHSSCRQFIMREFLRHSMDSGFIFKVRTF